MLSPHDSVLLKQMQATNEAMQQRGWREWYERDYCFLKTFVNRRYNNGCSAHSQDIVQDSFLIGFKNISSKRYKEQGKSLRAYLCGIAKNIIRGAIRLQSKEFTVEYDIGSSVEVVDAIDDKIDLEKILIWVAVARYEQPWLNLCVINGCYTQNKSSKELGEELDKSASNIRVINHRSVNKIREDLEYHYDLYLSKNEVRTFLRLF